MGNPRNASYRKGRSDQRHHARQSRNDIGHAIADIFSPCYRPSSKHGDAYKAGWRDSERKSPRR